MVSLQLISATSAYPLYAIAGRQHLRSAATGTLLVPRAWTVTGQRSFAVNGPATWNRLPPARSPDLSESAFKRALKTHQFSTARRHSNVFMILAPDINIIYNNLLTYDMLLRRNKYMVYVNVYTLIQLVRFSVMVRAGLVLVLISL